MAATSKTIVLKGDKSNPEPAEHHIVFPGGSVSVCRTSNEEYWVHITVNKKQILDDTFNSQRGEIKDIRQDEDHFAVLVSTNKE